MPSPGGLLAVGRRARETMNRAPGQYRDLIDTLGREPEPRGFIIDITRSDYAANVRAKVIAEGNRRGVRVGTSLKGGRILVFRKPKCWHSCP